MFIVILVLFLKKTVKFNNIKKIIFSILQLILSSIGRNGNSVNPFDRLKVDDLHKELFQRDLLHCISGILILFFKYKLYYKTIFIKGIIRIICGAFSECASC